VKMYEAAQVVLEESGRPMHAREIYERIRSKDLFRFGAKNPVSILSQTLRSKSIGVMKSGEPSFLREGPGIYGLAKWRERSGTS